MWSSAAMSEFVASAAQFFGEERYWVAGAGIRRKRRIIDWLFRVVDPLSRSQFGNLLLLVVVMLVHPGFRRPSGGPLFQYGLSGNNLRAFQRINKVVGRQDWDAAINGLPIRFVTRIFAVARVGLLASTARMLTDQRRSDAFGHTQLVIASAALLLLGLARFSGVRLICVATDHTPIPMAVVHAAKLRGLMTCYLQHAPVADYFPPLNYDLSILFDRESVDAYERAAQRRQTITRGRVVILPPFDTECASLALCEPRYRVGVCLSYLFDGDRVHKLVEQLSSHPNVSRVLLRRHPRCTASIGRLLQAGSASEPPRGTVADFLAQCDLVLVPNSGVAIEAMHLGKPTFYTPGMDSIEFDYYGFVKAGVLPIFTIDLLDDRNRLMSFFGHEWRERYSTYDETAKIPLGRSRQEARDAFLALLEEC